MLLTSSLWSCALPAAPSSVLHIMFPAFPSCLRPHHSGPPWQFCRVYISSPSRSPQVLPWQFYRDEAQRRANMPSLAALSEVELRRVKAAATRLRSEVFQCINLVRGGEVRGGEMGEACAGRCSSASTW